MRRVHLLPCGYEECDKGSLTLMKDYGQIVDLPYYVYLIEDDESAILVDTGCSDNWKELHPEIILKLYPPHIKDEERFERVLGSVGFKPDDVDFVINTHLHYDHCGNNRLFSRARILVNETELQHALAPGWWESLPYVRATFDIPQLKYQTVRGAFDVTPGVRIIPTPGHTAGHQSVVVKLEKTGTLVLAGDAISHRENLELPILPGLYVDAEMYAHSKDQLRQLAESGTLVLTHSREYLTRNAWLPMKDGVQVFE